MLKKKRKKEKPILSEAHHDEREHSAYNISII